MDNPSEPSPVLGTLAGMGGYTGPFRGSASGFTPHTLNTYKRLHEDVYIDPEVPLGPLLRARAADLYARGTGVLGGLSAAAVHGAGFIDDDEPAELIRPRRASHRTSTDLVVRNQDLRAREITRARGMLVTSPARTAFDLGRRRGRDAATVRLDALLRATGIGAGDVRAVAHAHPRMHGTPRLRALLPLVDPGAESPPETRTRLLIVDSGLPVPRTQVRIADGRGRIVARADLGWPQWRVAVEYDGAWHWEKTGQRGYDIVRHERLTALGWRVVRVTADQLRDEPAAVIARIATALRAAGAPV